MWESKKDSAPKTIDQIHKDAQMEEFAMKQKAQELKQSNRQQMQNSYNDRKYQSSYSSSSRMNNNNGPQSQQEWQLQTASSRPQTDIRTNLSKISSTVKTATLVSPIRSH